MKKPTFLTISHSLQKARKMRLSKYGPSFPLSRRKVSDFAWNWPQIHPICRLKNWNSWYFVFVQWEKQRFLIRYLPPRNQIFCQNRCLWSLKYNWKPQLQKFSQNCLFSHLSRIKSDNFSILWRKSTLICPLKNWISLNC